MEKTFFQDAAGKPFMPIGLQVHNSSTGSSMIKKAVQAVKAYGGNCLEAPVYWCCVEPEQDRYDLELVKGIVDEARSAGLHLILLWFGTSKNGHPNYVPEYIKLQPQTYRLALGPDKAPVPSLSVHCRATLERDKKAFVKFMEFLKAYDEEERTVLAVQIENEMGYANTDRDYSRMADRDYEKPVPEALKDVELPDSGKESIPADSAVSPWKKQFGRHSHEAFSAWHHALYINEIAEAGKGIYRIPMITNVMVGEQSYEEPGLCYNAGAAVGRVLDIWKAGAPALDLLGPDIYNQNRREYVRICEAYARKDNPLFIPESPVRGEANAMNALLAAADYGAVGICAFGAESALDEDGKLMEDCRDMALTMRILSSMTPLLIRYWNTGRVHAFAEEEFETSHYLKLPEYHVVAKYLRHEKMYFGYTTDTGSEEGRKKAQVRGRALLVQTGPCEFYLGGAGVALDFYRRPAPGDEDCFSHLSSRQSGQLNFLSVEEGHFDGETWVTELMRNGDETNFSQYVLDGQLLRIRLNPDTGMDVEDK